MCRVTDFRVLLLSGLLLGLCAAAPRAQEQSGAEPPPADLTADPRLDRRVSVRIKSGSLRELLEELSLPGLPLRTAPTWAQRRVTCLGKAARLRDLMTALGDVHLLSWRAERPVGAGGQRQEGGYELYQTTEQRRREHDFRAISEARTRRIDGIRRAAVLRAIEDALRRPEQAGATGDLLRRLTPRQMAAVGDLTAQPQGIIQIGSSEFMYEKMVGVTPFAALPPATQGRLKAEFGSLAPGFARPAEGSDGFARTSVGLTVGPSGVGLVVLDAAGRKNWGGHPERTVRRRGIPGVDSDDVNEPEVHEAVAREAGALVRLNGRERRGSRLRFSQVKKRGLLPECLESIFDQTGIAFVADDFMRSRIAGYYWVLTDQDEYSLSEALGQIGRAFGHRFRERDGIVQVTTLTPGLDAISDPFPSFLERLREIARHKSSLTWQDHLELGRLSDRQWHTLLYRPGGLVPPVPGLHRVYIVRRVLRAYLTLTPEERRAAATREGLDLARVSLRRRHDFWLLLNVGYQARRPTAGEVAPRRLFFQRTPSGKEKEAVTLRLTGEPHGSAQFTLSVGAE